MEWLAVLRFEGQEAGAVSVALMSESRCTAGAKGATGAPRTNESQSYLAWFWQGPVSQGTAGSGLARLGMACLGLAGVARFR